MGGGGGAWCVVGEISGWDVTEGEARRDRQNFKLFFFDEGARRASSKPNRAIQFEQVHDVKNLPRLQEARAAQRVLCNKSVESDRLKKHNLINFQLSTRGTKQPWRKGTVERFMSE